MYGRGAAGRGGGRGRGGQGGGGRGGFLAAGAASGFATNGNRRLAMLNSGPAVGGAAMANTGPITLDARFAQLAQKRVSDLRVPVQQLNQNLRRQESSYRVVEARNAALNAMRRGGALPQNGNGNVGLGGGGFVRGGRGPGGGRVGGGGRIVGAASFGGGRGVGLGRGRGRQAGGAGGGRNGVSNADIAASFGLASKDELRPRGRGGNVAGRGGRGGRGRGRGGQDVSKEDLDKDLELYMHNSEDMKTSAMEE